MTEHKNTADDIIIDQELADVLAEALTPIAPPAKRAGELKSRVMARISGRKSFDLMTVKADEGQWFTLLPGVEKKILSESVDGKVQSFLLRMVPGAQIPAHKHIVDEESLMLEGEAMVGELHLSAGDYHFARKGSLHGLVTTPTGCLIFLRTSEVAA